MDISSNMNDNYIFEGLRTKKAKEKVLKLLKCCKEIRDTAYPLKNSKITELSIVDLKAQKQKDYIYVTGSLLLKDKKEEEHRTFEAYITSKEQEDHVLLDITRIDLKETPNMIRTTDIITENEKNIVSKTTYCGIGYLQEKIYLEELDKNLLSSLKAKQLSVL